jgi:hypothetical protein
MNRCPNHKQLDLKSRDYFRDKTLFDNNYFFELQSGNENLLKTFFFKTSKMTKVRSIPFLSEEQN